MKRLQSLVSWQHLLRAVTLFGSQSASLLGGSAFEPCLQHSARFLAFLNFTLLPVKRGIVLQTRQIQWKSYQPVHPKVLIMGLKLTHGRIVICLQGHCNQFPRLPLENVVMMEERGGSRSWANRSMIQKKKSFQKQQN